MQDITCVDQPFCYLTGPSTSGPDPDAGSGGGTQQVFQGHGDPLDPPTVLTLPALYADLDSGTVWTWSVESQSWF